MSFHCFRYSLCGFQGANLNGSNSFSRVNGDEGNRTPDPLLARQVLSQLSYTPRVELVLLLRATQVRMDLSGLEPPTSRLSGGRSNRLSYKPIFRLAQFPKPKGSLDVSIHGGDKRDRTADPLLAKQVLSQLSYTPISS